MNEHEQADLDRARTLMMAALDAEATPAERRELEQLLDGRPELRAEWTRLQRLKEVTATMTLRQPAEEVWDRYCSSVLHRTERTIAWTLVTLGAAVVGGWALWHWLEAMLGASDLPVVIRAAIIAVALGLILLAVSVVRERWILHRKDPYSREVTR